MYSSYDDGFWVSVAKFFLGTAKDWPLGTLLAFLIVVLFAFVLSISLWGVYIAIDSWYLPMKHAWGKIVGNEYTPTHTSLIWNGSFFMPVFHSENFYVIVDVPSENQQGSMCVDENYYHQARKGMKVKAGYFKGRISGNIYIKQLS